NTARPLPQYDSRGGLRHSQRIPFCPHRRQRIDSAGAFSQLIRRTAKRAGARTTTTLPEGQTAEARMRPPPKAWAGLAVRVTMAQTRTAANADTARFMDATRWVVVWSRSLSSACGPPDATAPSCISRLARGWRTGAEQPAQHILRRRRWVSDEE